MLSHTSNRFGLVKAVYIISISVLLLISSSSTAIETNSCATWIQSATLDNGSATIGKGFVWALNSTNGVVLMDMGAAKEPAIASQSTYDLGVRKVNLNAITNNQLLNGMGLFDVGTDGTTYMAATPTMGTGASGGNNVIKITPNGVASIIATIDTKGAGFGDVYAHNGWVYVSSIGDGLIYKINPLAANPATSFSAVYNHGRDGRANLGLFKVQDSDASSQWSNQYKGTLPGRRVTALYIEGSILFYAVMWSDTAMSLQPNIYANPSEAYQAYNAKTATPKVGEIWTVQLDSNGDPLVNTASLLLDQTNLTNQKENYPIADMTISNAGKLIVGTAPYHFTDHLGQHAGGIFALSKDTNGHYTQYESYAHIRDSEGTGGVDAFGQRVLVGGEYNEQNTKAYGFANIAETGTGGNEIHIGTPDNTTEFYSSYGSGSGGTKGSTGDVEYICGGPTPICQLDTPTITTTCDNHGTPSDATDDTFSYTIQVSGQNTSTSYQISGADSQSKLAYNLTQGPFASFSMQGTNQIINLTDSTNSACKLDNIALPKPVGCAIPAKIDLQLTKTVVPTQVKPGDLITYTLTVVNNGPDKATNVMIKDALPNNMIYKSHVGGVYTNSEWQVGNLAVGVANQKTLNITAQVAYP
jgi:uncharacterized repeat protein (TIGR01451 family)